MILTFDFIGVFFIFFSYLFTPCSLLGEERGRERRRRVGRSPPKKDPAILSEGPVLFNTPEFSEHSKQTDRAVHSEHSVISVLTEQTEHYESSYHDTYIDTYAYDVTHTPIIHLALMADPPKRLSDHNRTPYKISKITSNLILSLSLM